jgi:hypothetical protein
MGKVLEVVNFSEARIALRHSEQLFIFAALIIHEEDADRSDADAAAGKCGLLNQNQDVERVAIPTLGPDDESIVAGIVHRRKENAVQANGR